jgi:4-amino-4-deoxy-L-arabinose transferase-like glycosyltransferase
MLPTLWWIARRLTEPRTAAWATVLWASCFPAIDIARRSLIEPIQMVWLLGLLAAITLTGPATGALVAVATAGLLLTKANAIVLLPAFALALWWDRAPLLHERRVQKLLAIGIGVVLAGLGFLLLYLTDPPTFVKGWEAILRKPALSSESPVIRIGRFVLDPALALSGVNFVATQTPFLMAFGVVGALRALRDREVVAAGAWVMLLFPFLLLQVLQTPQYFSLLYPAMALAAATLLADADRTARRRAGWPALALALMITDGLVRTTGAMLTVRRTDLATIDWLREQVAPGERVLSVPVLLMQLPARGTSMFELGGPGYVPTPALITRHDARWVVVDRDDWQVRLGRAGLDSAAIADTLRPCCELAHADGYAWTYRVRAPH